MHSRYLNICRLPYSKIQTEKKKKKYMEIGSKTYDIVTVKWIKSVCGMGKIWKQTKKTKIKKMAESRKMKKTLFYTIYNYSI